MWRRNRSYSNHHILPQHPANTRERGSDHPNNLIRMDDVKHRSQHNLFDNLMLPEQILKLIEMSEKALKPEVVKELKDFIRSRDIHNPREWYKDEYIR